MSKFEKVYLIYSDKKCHHPASDILELSSYSNSCHLYHDKLLGNDLFQ